MRVETKFPDPYSDEPIVEVQVPEGPEDEELLAYQSETWADIAPFASQSGVDRYDLERAGVERIVKRMRGLAQDERIATAFLDEEIAEAEKSLAALRTRRDELVKPIQRRREWLNGYLPALQAWAARELYGRKERSIKLAYGTLKFRKSPDRVDITDEAAAVAWAQEHGYLDAITVHASKSGLKKRMQDTGEVVPGATYVVGDDTFVVDVLEAD